MENGFSIPIAIVIFNRPAITEKLIGVLCKIQPKDLFVIADGAREDVTGEKEKVNLCKDIIEKINWNCNIHKNYSGYNMGCDNRVVSGLDWLFSIVDKAIILEDDCIPDDTFFEFCEEMLNRYEKDSRVSYIAGSNQIDNYNITDSYLFTYRAWAWGWATWKRSWDQYIEVDEQWDQVSAQFAKVKQLLHRDKQNFKRELKKCMNNGNIPWDYSWHVTTLLNGGLSIVPKYNLIVNIGFTEDATHTISPIIGYKNSTQPLDFPLKHPSEVKADRKYYKAAYYWLNPKLIKKVIDINFYKRQLLRMFKR